MQQWRLTIFSNLKVQSLRQQISTSTSKPEDNPSSSTINSESAPSTSTSKTQGVLPSSITKTDTLHGKILWCLKVVKDHQSFHSCLGNNQLFQWMFPDSAIAKNFQLPESKCKYMTVFGLGSYVQDILRAHIKESSHYVIIFYESLNQKLQKKQMDFLLRTWQHNEVHTRYLTSVFIGHGTAVHLKPTRKNLQRSFKVLD